MHGLQAIEHRPLARAAVPVVRKTRGPQGGQLRNELVGKFFTNPILRDNGGNLCLQESPDPLQKGLVFLAQGRANGVEIAIGLRKRLLCRNTHGRFLLYLSITSVVQLRTHSVCALIIACPLSRRVWSRCSSTRDRASRSGPRCWTRWNQPCQRCCWASVQRKSSIWACCTFLRSSVGLPDVTWTRSVQSRNHLAWASSVSCPAVFRAFTVSFHVTPHHVCSLPRMRSCHPPH